MVQWETLKWEGFGREIKGLKKSEILCYDSNTIKILKKLTKFKIQPIEKKIDIWSKLSEFDQKMTKIWLKGD